MMHRVQEERAHLRQLELELKLTHPKHQMQQKRQLLADLEDELDSLMRQRVQAERHRLALLTEKLQGLSPLLKISKGFAFVTKEDGEKIESTAQVKAGEVLKLHLADGVIWANVLEPEEKGSD